MFSKALWPNSLYLDMSVPEVRYTNPETTLHTSIEPCRKGCTRRRRRPSPGFDMACSVLFNRPLHVLFNFWIHHRVAVVPQTWAWSVRKSISLSLLPCEGAFLTRWLLWFFVRRAYFESGLLGLVQNDGNLNSSKRHMTPTWPASPRHVTSSN